MFDLIIREAASRFGLGDKAGPLVQMLLAYLTNKDTGGVSGFIAKLTSSGLGNVAQSWLGGGAGALPVSAAQIESLMGGQTGLLSNITLKLGIGNSTAASALGFLLPMVIGKLTPGGTIPTSLSSDVMGFSTGGGLMKCLPWLAAGIAALFLLSYCNKGSDAAKQATDGAKNAAATASTASTATDTAKAAADAATKAKADAEAAAKATADAAAKAAALNNEEARRVEVTIRK